MSAGPVRRPRDTWDWFSLVEVERLILPAFLAACRHQSPPPGEPFLLDGSPWSSREDFRGCFVAMFAQRLNVLALDRGVSGSSGSVWPDLPPGRSWDMAHGCAALDSGAGAPPAPSPDADITSPDNPLFTGQQGQDLPRPDYPVNTQFPREVACES